MRSAVIFSVINTLMTFFNERKKEGKKKRRKEGNRKVAGQ